MRLILPYPYNTVLSYLIKVQLDGIGAAISNLQYFHASISKAYLHYEVPCVLILFDSTFMLIVVFLCFVQVG